MSYGQHATPRSRGMLRTVLSWAGYIRSLSRFGVGPADVRGLPVHHSLRLDGGHDRNRRQRLVRKGVYYFRDVEQGDIVTFDDPEIAGRTLIKRVIAAGGQTVRSCRRRCVRRRDGS